ncbi:MAG: hypothetical protein Q7S70_00405 [bacterium]|nr:hypothetical protein [bacterium]
MRMIVKELISDGREVWGLLRSARWSKCPGSGFFLAVSVSQSVPGGGAMFAPIFFFPTASSVVGRRSAAEV